MHLQHKRFYVGLGIVAALLTGFAFVADDVMEGETQAFDNAVLMAFRVPGQPETPIGPHWLVEAIRDVTALGSFSVLGALVAIVVIYLLLVGQRGKAVLILGSVISGTIVSTVLKYLFDRPRPDLTGVAEVFTSSFPSGHALVSAVTFLTIGAILAAATKIRRLRIFYVATAILLTLIVGSSRVYLGVHYPTDVIAGWSLGAAWALGAFIVARLLRHRNKIEPEAKGP